MNKLFTWHFVTWPTMFSFFCVVKDMKKVKENNENKKETPSGK